MSLVVVGGQAKNVGKTTLVCNLVSAFPERRWVAAKITTHKHDPLGCELKIKGDSWSVWEQTVPTVQTDTARYINAGAERALLVQSDENSLHDACETLRALVSKNDLIVESSSAADLLDPDLFLLIIDPARPEFKVSAERQLENIDAFVWNNLKAGIRDDRQGTTGKPSFRGQPEGLDPALQAFVRTRLRDG